MPSDLATRPHGLPSTVKAPPQTDTPEAIHKNSEWENDSYSATIPGATMLPPVNSISSLSPAVQRLATHVARCVKEEQPRLNALRQTAVERLRQRQQTHVILDTSWLFPDDLCAALVKEGATQEEVRKCVLPWAEWTKQLIENVFDGDPKSNKSRHYQFGVAQQVKKRARGEQDPADFWHVDSEQMYLTAQITIVGPSTEICPGPAKLKKAHTKLFPRRNFPRFDLVRREEVTEAPARGHTLIFNATQRTDACGAPPLVHRAPDNPCDRIALFIFGFMFLPAPFHLTEPKSWTSLLRFYLNLPPKLSEQSEQHLASPRTRELIQIEPVAIRT